MKKTNSTTGVHQKNVGIMRDNKGHFISGHVGYNKKEKPVCFICKKKCKGQNNRFCSNSCYSKSRIGKKHSWGYKIGNALRGIPKSKEHREKVAAIIRSMTPEERNIPRGKNHFQWKGDSAKFGTIHDWVYRYKGSPKKCEECYTTTKKVYHWANISGEYKRELNDWKRLCAPCHSKFDKGRNSLKKRFPQEF